MPIDVFIVLGIGVISGTTLMIIMFLTDKGEEDD